MQGVIDQHLDTIMGTLARLLDTAPISVKAVVTGAIGSAAHASKSKFLPYFQPTMSHLQQYFSVMKGKDKDKEDELRGIAMDAVGTIAEAVGKEVFRPYFPNMMQQAFEGLGMDSPRLKECSFLFFSVMARVFGEEFAIYLPAVVPPLLESCRQTEGGEKSDASGKRSPCATTHAYLSLQYPLHLPWAPQHPIPLLILILRMMPSRSTWTNCWRLIVPLPLRKRSPLILSERSFPQRSVISFLTSGIARSSSKTY